MSHLPERKENNCLNCNAVVHGRYCHVCGQQNIEPREGFWNMLTHFVFDLFHFDGKFFSTIKFLLFKPGYLSLEHLKGRRADYLHPIRMYIFTSAFFFLLLFSFSNNMENAIQFNKSNTKARDTASKQKINIIESDGIKYKSKAEYLAMQQKLPKAKQDGYIQRKIKLQEIHLNNDYGSSKEAFEAVIKNFIRNFPKLLFISLPLFAFVLYLIYIRRRTYFFSDHLVYTLHLYCAFFIIILFSLAFRGGFGLLGMALDDAKGNDTTLGSWIYRLTIFTLLFYWYKSLRRFYAQSRRKTILKFSLLLFINLFVFVILFVGFILFSAMTS